MAAIYLGAAVLRELVHVNIEYSEMRNDNMIKVRDSAPKRSCTSCGDHHDEKGNSNASLQAAKICLLEGKKMTDQEICP